MDQNYPSTSSFKGYFVSSACSQYRSATSSYMTFVQRPYRIKRAPEIWSDYQRGRDWGPYHHAAPKLLQDGQWFRGSGSTIALETEFTRESVSGVSEIVVYKTIYKEAPMKWTFSSIIVVALIAFVVMKLQNKLTFYQACKAFMKLVFWPARAVWRSMKKHVREIQREDPEPYDYKKQYPDPKPGGPISDSES